MVTGGGGFIGTNLVNELRARVNEVLVVDPGNTEKRSFLSGQMSGISGRWTG